MRRLLVNILFVFAIHCAFAQEPVSDLYQYNYATINPAFAGIDGQKITATPRMMSNNGKSIRSMGFVGYEGRIKNSGFGVSGISTGIGPQTDSYLNAFYNYQWKLADGSKFVVAGKMSSYHLSIDFSKYNPIDPNDPLLDIGNPVKSQSHLLFGLGVLYKRDRFFVGLSTDNLVDARLKSDDIFKDQKLEMKKLFHYIAGMNFNLGANIRSTHSIYAYTLGNAWRVDLNNSITFGWFIAGLSLESDDGNNDILPKVNAGIKLKDKGQIVVGLYSQHGKLPSYTNAQMMLQFNLD